MPRLAAQRRWGRPSGAQPGRAPFSSCPVHRAPTPQGTCTDPEPRSHLYTLERMVGLAQCSWTREVLGGGSGGSNQLQVTQRMLSSLSSCHPPISSVAFPMRSNALWPTCMSLYLQSKFGSLGAPTRLCQALTIRDLLGPDHECGKPARKFPGLGSWLPVLVWAPHLPRSPNCI